jgi:hypothetical protein
MTNEENVESQAAPAVAAEPVQDAAPNGVAASHPPTQPVAPTQAHSRKAGSTHEPGGTSDAQDFARRMKGIFASVNDLACKGPQVAGEFVSLLHEAVKLNHKNALAIMLKQTVQKNEHEVLIPLLA